MKNSILLLLASGITLSFFGSLKENKKELSNNIQQNSYKKDTLIEKLDSLQLLKTKIEHEYSRQIQSSFEIIKNEKKKQKELLLSTDSLFNMANITNTINNK